MMSAEFGQIKCVFGERISIYPTIQTNISTIFVFKQIVHLDKKDVTKKQNLRYSWDAVDVDVSPSFDTCLPVGYDISKLAEDYTASAEKACDFCCSKKCSAFNVVQKIGGFKDAGLVCL